MLDNQLILPHKFNHLSKSFSTSTPTPNTTSLNWRSQIKQSQLVSQISSILLQRHNWAPLLRTLNHSSSQLTPSLFLHILRKTKTNPQVSLSFFNWAKSRLGFEPDLKTLVTLSEILIGSGLARQAKPVLDALIKDNPPTRIVNSAVGTCRGTDSQSLVLDSILECYCKKSFFLEVYREAISHGYILSICSCNALQLENKIRLAWCFYGNMLRNGILPDTYMWSTIARILCKDGNLKESLGF